MKHLITVADTGENFFCNQEQHLLQGMQSFKLGMPLLAAIPVGCRGGGCGVCRIKVLDGCFESRKMSRKHVSEADQKEGIVLACRISPRSELVIEVSPSTSNEA